MIEVMAGILVRMLMSPVFGHLEGIQRAAVVQALSLTVAPLGRVPYLNRYNLRRELLDLPWAWEPCAYTADGLVSRSGFRLNRIWDTASLQMFGRELAASLDSAALRGQTYAVMVALAFADGIQLRELVALEVVRRGFGVRPARGRGAGRGAET